MPQFERLGINQLRHFETVLDNYLQAQAAFQQLLYDPDFTRIFSSEKSTLEQIRKELARRNAR